MIDAKTIEELRELCKRVDDTLQAMASQAFVPMGLWDKHSNGVLALIARIRALSAENERLKTMLTGGNLEIVESEQAWKLRAESSEALVAELREKVERLTKALEPFAKAASDYERQGEFFSDNVELVLRVSVFAAPEYHNSTAVQVGDLRRACTALEGRDA